MFLQIVYIFISIFFRKIVFRLQRFIIIDIYRYKINYILCILLFLRLQVIAELTYTSIEIDFFFQPKSLSSLVDFPSEIRKPNHLIDD